MADVVRLTSHSRLLFSSPLLLPFRSNASPLKGPFKQQSPGDARRVSAAPLFFTRRKSSPSFKVHATAVGKDDEPKWWERIAGPNMVDINSTEEFLSALSQAGDKLVIVEFYGTWCASCRALFPKLCKIAQEHPDILFLKVNFDKNKPMCRDLNVKVLPYFHFYSGANGQLESFSCSLAKIQKIRKAIERHNAAHSSITQPLGVGDNGFLGVSNPRGKPAAASSR